MRKRGHLTLATLLLIASSASAQTLAPQKLRLPAEQQPKKGSVEVIRSAEPQVITNVNQPPITKSGPKVITKDAPIVHKEKHAAVTKPAPRYTFKTPEGTRESAPLITHYYPKQLVYPFAKVDRRIDPKLTRAATIAQERAHAHSRSMCWHAVKEALLASGVIDSRPKSEYAKDAAQDLVTNYGFKKLPVHDPFAAPVGSVLVYGSGRAAGHVELRTRDGFVSDFRSPTPSRRPLIGIYAKL